MTTIVYRAFSGLNNALCAKGSRGWLTAPFVPIIVGGLNILIWVGILITSIILRYATVTHFQNTNKQGTRSFLRSFSFAILDWYFALLIITLFYKLFLCRSTIGITKAYSKR